MEAQDATVAGVSGRYASALFELALEEKALEQIDGDLGDFEALLNESDDLMRLVRSPAFSAEEQSRAISAVLDKAGMDGLARNFIALVAKNRRLFAVLDMIRDFRKLLAAHRGEVSADVISAHKLSGKQLDALKASLRKATGSEVRMETRVDEALLGGLVVKVGSRMVDGSLKTKLDNLRLAMKEVG